MNSFTFKTDMVHIPHLFLLCMLLAGQALYMATATPQDEQNPVRQDLVTLAQRADDITQLVSTQIKHVHTLADVKIFLQQLNSDEWYQKVTQLVDQLVYILSFTYFKQHGDDLAKYQKTIGNAPLIPAPYADIYYAINTYTSRIMPLLDILERVLPTLGTVGETLKARLAQPDGESWLRALADLQTYVQQHLSDLQKAMRTGAQATPYLPTVGETASILSVTEVQNRWSAIKKLLEPSITGSSAEFKSSLETALNQLISLIRDRINLITQLPIVALTQTHDYLMQSANPDQYIVQSLQWPVTLDLTQSVNQNIGTLNTLQDLIPIIISIVKHLRTLTTRLQEHLEHNPLDQLTTVLPTTTEHVWSLADLLQTAINHITTGKPI